MVGLQNNIKVTIIRNAAGSRSGSTQAGCRDSAPTYYCAARLSSELPSTCGGNTQDLYDPSMPRKVINIMNYFGAPSRDFIPFDRTDLTNPLDLQCELQAGDELVCIWKPLVILSPTTLVATYKPERIVEKAKPVVVIQEPAIAKPPPSFVLVRQPDGTSKLVKS